MNLAPSRPAAPVTTLSFGFPLEVGPFGGPAFGKVVDIVRRVGELHGVETRLFPTNGTGGMTKHVILAGTYTGAIDDVRAAIELLNSTLKPA